MSEFTDHTMPQPIVAEESPRPFGFGQRPASVSFSLPPLPHLHSSLLGGGNSDRSSFTPSLSSEIAAAQAGVDTTGMTPRTAFAALMEAVHVLKKEKPSMPSIFSPTLTSPALPSPFMGSASPTGGFGMPNPWSLSVPVMPTSPRPGPDQHDLTRRIHEIVNMSWNTLEQMQRPPRDMKRFDMADWYVVCKVLKWGQNTALLVRKLSSPTKDFGMYKPPIAYANHEFKAGDRIKLAGVGYSESRNRIATKILIESSDGTVVDVQIDESTSGASGKADGRGGKGSRKVAAETSKRKKTGVAARKAGESAASGSQAAKASSAPRQNLAAPMSITDLTSTSILRILELPWPSNLGSRPPRDMKRLALGKWYLVCKVSQRGESIALFLRSVDEPEEDFGYYKPPSKYDKYGFAMGELVQLQSIGYSPGRNKVAIDIYIDRKGVDVSANPSAVFASTTPEITEIPPSAGISPERGPESSAFAEDSSKRMKLAEELAFPSGVSSSSAFAGNGF